ncbi:MAG: LysM peptidoglycan-binding domain-containing protein [Pseudomonadota bacterium]|nr:LysM peptidoglycan-binding domain-containing protein [Pseudomonadota bacterium]
MFIIWISLHGCSYLTEKQTPVADNPTPVSTAPPPAETPYSDSHYHIVQRGETLYGIAKQYGVNYKAVAQWNGIEPPYIIDVGQRLMIAQSATPHTPAPTESYPSSTPTQNTTSGDYYIVQAGDNLYKIAQQHGYQVEQLAAWNGLYPPYNLAIGQKLKVSPSTTEAVTYPEATQPQTTARSHRHTVQSGDTLYSIAKQYGYRVEDIAAWNTLQPPYSLSPGQVLIVSPPTQLPATNAAANEVYHVVVPGENLYQISKRYGYSVEQLAQWNALTPPYNLAVGQRLRVSPQASAQQHYLSPPNVRTQSQYHVVQPGETLSSIAAQYRMSDFELANLNGIGSPYTVYPGQKLVVIPQN